MALIKCLDCSRDVSDKAAVCPNCGYPIGGMLAGLGRAQIIEKTRKRWKAIRVLGWLLFFNGVLVLRRGRAATDTGRGQVGWWMTAAGVACLITSKVGASWYHG
jgi:hypothetical protein